MGITVEVRPSGSSLPPVATTPCKGRNMGGSGRRLARKARGRGARRDWARETGSLTRRLGGRAGGRGV